MRITLALVHECPDADRHSYRQKEQARGNKAVNDLLKFCVRDVPHSVPRALQRGAA